MGTTSICNADNIISSRDIIARIAELVCLIDSDRADEDEKEELGDLFEVCMQGERNQRWASGVLLIHENHFLGFTIQHAGDWDAMFHTAWPWKHMKMDWEAAEEELKQQCTTIKFGNVTYFVWG